MIQTREIGLDSRQEKRQVMMIIMSFNAAGGLLYFLIFMFGYSIENINIIIIATIFIFLFLLK